MNNEIVIGMGAGSISQWMRNLKGKLMNSEIKKFKKKFERKPYFK